MLATRGYAAKSPASELEPFQFERREPGPDDVLIDIQFCGICHGDFHGGDAATDVVGDGTGFVRHPTGVAKIASFSSATAAANLKVYQTAAVANAATRPRNHPSLPLTGLQFSSTFDLKDNAPRWPPNIATS